MEEDTQAALEWMVYKASLCPGCGQPKHESFDPATDGGPGHLSYDVTVLECHACEARERLAYNRNANRERDMPPEHGKFYVVTGPTDD